MTGVPDRGICLHLARFAVAPPARRMGKTKKKAASEGGAEDGDIGAIRRDAKKKKQALVRKKRTPGDKPKRAPKPKAVTPKPSQPEAVEDGASSANTPASYAAKQAAVLHMDQLAEHVVNRLALMNPKAQITVQAVYTIAEFTRRMILEILKRTVELGDKGAGSAREPLDHSDAFAATRTVVPENLATILLFRSVIELGDTLGTRDQAEVAFAKFVQATGENQPGVAPAAEAEPAEATHGDGVEEAVQQDA